MYLRRVTGNCVVILIIDTLRVLFPVLHSSVNPPQAIVVLSLLVFVVDHSLSLLPLSSVLDALGDAVKSALDSSADVANSIADGLSSAASRRSDGITNTASRGSSNVADCATEATNGVAQGAGEEVGGSSDCVADIASGAVALVVVHDGGWWW